MSILVLTAVLSTQIPEASVDQTWGHHMRSRHHAGAWRIEVGAHRFSGDWIVVDEQDGYVRGRHGRKIRLVGTTSGTSCTIDHDTSRRLRCDGATLDAHVTGDVELGTSTAVLEGYACERGSCRPVRAGTIAFAVRPIAPTLAQAELAFERVHGRTIAAQLGATRKGDVLRMPYRIVERAQEHALGGFTQEVIQAEATIDLAATPKLRVVARETGRYRESCRYPAHAATSCMMVMPDCTRM